MAIQTFHIHKTHIVNRPIGRERSAGNRNVPRNRWQRKRKSLRSRSRSRLSLELAFVLLRPKVEIIHHLNGSSIEMWNRCIDLSRSRW